MIQRSLLAISISISISLLSCAPAPPPPAPVPAPTGSALAPLQAEAPRAPGAAQSASADAGSAPASCPAGMALLPGGEGYLGGAKVKIKPFCLDQTEVTAEAYGTCVKAGKCDGAQTNVCDPYTIGRANQGKLPMVCVDFAQAEKFCAAQEKRLSTTEEWQWAARGGSASGQYPWGNGDIEDRICWSGSVKRDGLCFVGSAPKGDSPQGVHDLLGSVAEWTHGKGDATSGNRFAQGGSYKDADKAALTRQASFKSGYRAGFVGFRCAKGM